MDGSKRRCRGPALLLPLALCCSPLHAAADLSGSWVQKMHEDRDERAYGPEIGDYLGLPINAAARMRAETWDAAKWSVPEHQCEPHPADYAPHGPAALRIWSDVDPITQQVVAWHIVYQWMNSHRVIWMDGRPHPSEHAPHTWMGFSTGEWQGDTLVVHTTHLKEGWIRRNGVPRSDRGTLTEYWIRLGGYLTVLSAVEDPVYLTAPLVRSWNWVMDPGFQIAPYTCTSRVETELPRGFVAHHLPGTNALLQEFPKKVGLPARVTDGGADTMYPEFRDGERLKTPQPPAQAESRAHGAVASVPAKVELLPVQGSVFLLTAGGSNTIVQAGAEGTLVVDTQAAAASGALTEALAKLTDKPVRYILNTSADADHVGGNEALTQAGKSFNTFSGLAAYSKAPTEAPIYAHENVLKRMSDPAAGGSDTLSGSWPTETYFSASMELYFNGEPVQLLYMPAAHSDGDSIVYFQKSDVIATGDIFNMESYPVIDIARGGSIDGLIEALDRVIDLAIPERNEEGGTLIVPGHGRIGDEYDVVIYRDMVTVIRDRVQALIAKGMTLEQVQAAHVTMDYDGRYGTEQGTWTTRKFVEAVYRSLTATRAAGAKSAAS
ncbi:MAG TPA: MBL fold metallo-hydrolase [Steroidobacteraceae bacterium]|nr:MBL fold metallo-hydrolase [Steroidobacteraceae bacterium]